MISHLFCSFQEVLAQLVSENTSECTGHSPNSLQLCQRLQGTLYFVTREPFSNRAVANGVIDKTAKVVLG